MANYVYIEPMGHGNHFVAEIAQDTLIPGTVQLNILRADGTIERTIGMTGSSIFRWSAVDRETALVLAKKLEENRAVWTMTLPERLLIEASTNQLPGQKEGPVAPDCGDDEDEPQDGNDELTLTTFY
jgi:hypothetical protein